MQTNLTEKLDDFPFDTEDALMIGVDAIAESGGKSEHKNGFGCGSLASIIFVFVLASVYPGEPTIEPTENCTLSQAERCVELQSICNPTFDAMFPGVPSVQSTRICAVERPQLCRKCARALVGYDMSYIERLVYYGPWWFELPRWVGGFFQSSTNEGDDE